MFSQQIFSIGALVFRTGFARMAVLCPSSVQNCGGCSSLNKEHDPAKKLSAY